MKNIISYLVVICLFACQSEKPRSADPFTTNILQLQTFNIDASRDTSIETLHGSIIKILKGTFNITGEVKIEIKEALTPAEIFAAGLSTESNGRLLKSGGMIYLNGTINGEQVKITKPIKISVPNQYFDNSMQLFKGEESDSGVINWKDPQPLDTTDQALQWIAGKTFFKAKCSSCHNIFTDGTGPAMKDLEFRGPWTNRKNIYSFVANPGSFMSRNWYTQELKRKFGSMMTGFPDLSENDMDAILAYIKNESKRPGAMEEEKKYWDSLVQNTRLRLDSINGQDINAGDFIASERPCGEDTIYLPRQKAEQSFFTEDNSSVTSPDSLPRKADELEGLRNGFNDPNPTSGMYDFEVRTFGWYNIDAYVEGYAGSTNVKLWVQLQVQFDIDMHVYLFCPRNKMLSVMNDKRNGKFFFNKINDGIPLFLNDRAILFAFGSKGEKMYYAVKEFRIRGEQTIELKVKETTEGDIKEVLFSKQIEGIDLGVKKKEMQIIQLPCQDSLSSVSNKIESK
ncbi:c-type cytochrome [Terrimonas pollutisoli]|uniref:c-type cytochrome n=1 Tax=Terrimonas pollutisoli TaxID=3034147 RepID=UPI0023EACBAD|nr:cytochrome c [Terrimonas sp. H1YJ31]